MVGYSRRWRNRPDAGAAERVRQSPHHQGPHIAHAIIEAYSVPLSRAKPEVHLFIEMPRERST